MMLKQKTTKKQPYKRIPTRLEESEFILFVLPHLNDGSRYGPKLKLPLYKTFNYILHVMHTGCQWKTLQRCIDKNSTGKAEIHYTNVFKQFKKWCFDGSFKRLFEGSVLRLYQSNLLDLSVLHGDGTTTAAKKGGDNLGYSGHKHFKGEKVIAIADRYGNILSPYTTAPGNKNESPLFAPALTHLKSIIKQIGATAYSVLFATLFRFIPPPHSIAFRQYIIHHPLIKINPHFCCFFHQCFSV